jgi:hypothetical protein
LRKLADSDAAADGIVNGSVLLLPLAAPLHATNVFPAAMDALRLIDVPLMYEPAAHPTEDVGTRAMLPPVAPVTLVVNAKQGTKFACRLAAAAGILNVSGRLLLLDAPLHTLNV